MTQMKSERKVICHIILLLSFSHSIFVCERFVYIDKMMLLLVVKDEAPVDTLW
jgi:hypothetical protein